MFTKEKITNIVKRWIRKDRYIIAIAFVLGLLITGFVGFSKAYSDAIQTGLSQHLIRFHVIANSDSEEDQALKEDVRDAILAEMKDELNTATSIQETRQKLLDEKERIAGIAEAVVLRWGKEYPVEVSLTPAVFPTKKYGDVVLPAGEYEALRVIIGNGEGKNWWCVMFPPLCFVDITHGTVSEETKEELRNVLTEEEYDMVITAKSADIIPVKIKFKVVEWWQEQKLKNYTVFANPLKK